jgi:predicted nucleic acid-binding protein
MTSTLVDTNVLLDIIERRPSWFEWAARRIAEASGEGRIILNPVIYAEASTPYDSQVEFDAIIHSLGFAREEIPWNAAFLAAKAHLAYRQRGGVKNQTLPDFFIAAHAQVKGYAFVTRDAARFRTYFPGLDIIAPDTHP